MDISYSVNSRPKANQGTSSGDAARVIEFDANHMTLIAVVDALGHGKDAQKVAEQSLDFCERNADMPLIDIINELHTHMNKSRGLVLTLCCVDKRQEVLRYVSIGDTTIARLKSKPMRGVSRPGVVGYQMSQPAEYCWPLNDGDVIAIYSDGVQHFSLDQCGTAADDGAANLGRYIISNFAKPNDDALCLIMEVAS